MEKGRTRSTTTEKETATNENKDFGTTIAAIKQRKVPVKMVFTNLRHMFLELLL